MGNLQVTKISRGREDSSQVCPRCSDITEWEFGYSFSVPYVLFSEVFMIVIELSFMKLYDEACVPRLFILFN
jgi:hypothetical protein